VRVLPQTVRPLRHVVVLLLACRAAQAAERPNIIFVADDPGYGESGCHGGMDVPTPLNREMIEPLWSPGGGDGRRTKQ
jgi:hypothetical protein